MHESELPQELLALASAGSDCPNERLRQLLATGLEKAGSDPAAALSTLSRILASQPAELRALAGANLLDAFMGGGRDDAASLFSHSFFAPTRGNARWARAAASLGMELRRQAGALDAADAARRLTELRAQARQATPGSQRRGDGGRSKAILAVAAELFAATSWEAFSPEGLAAWIQSAKACREAALHRWGGSFREEPGELGHGMILTLLGRFPAALNEPTPDRRLAWEGWLAREGFEARLPGSSPLDEGLDRLRPRTTSLELCLDGWSKRLAGGKAEPAGMPDRIRAEAAFFGMPSAKLATWERWRSGQACLDAVQDEGRGAGKAFWAVCALGGSVPLPGELAAALASRHGAVAQAAALWEAGNEKDRRLLGAGARACGLDWSVRDVPGGANALELRLASALSPGAKYHDVMAAQRLIQTAAESGLAFRASASAPDCLRLALEGRDHRLALTACISLPQVEALLEPGHDGYDPFELAARRLGESIEALDKLRREGAIPDAMAIRDPEAWAEACDLLADLGCIPSLGKPWTDALADSGSEMAKAAPAAHAAALARSLRGSTPEPAAGEGPSSQGARL